jgi:hypothetical protein
MGQETSEMGNKIICLFVCLLITITVMTKTPCRPYALTMSRYETHIGLSKKNNQPLETLAMGHHGHSFVTKLVKKSLKNMFLVIFSSKTI